MDYVILKLTGNGNQNGFFLKRAEYEEKNWIFENQNIENAIKITK